jgi:predicted DNA-binding transcriptional regulator AlpA
MNVAGKVATAEKIDPWLQDKEVARILQISRVTVWRRVADGTIPQPFKFGRLSRWALSEILAVK